MHGRENSPHDLIVQTDRNAPDVQSLAVQTDVRFPPTESFLYHLGQIKHSVRGSIPRIVDTAVDHYPVAVDQNDTEIGGHHIAVGKIFELVRAQDIFPVAGRHAVKISQ